MNASQPGRRPRAPEQITYTADFHRPGRWWIAGTDGKPPRASTQYEPARVASLALQNAIRAARTAPAPARDDAPAATTHSLLEERRTHAFFREVERRAALR